VGVKAGESPYDAYDIPIGIIKALAKNMKTIGITVIFIFYLFLIPI
jgi:hypothetical protein